MGIITQTQITVLEERGKVTGKPGRWREAMIYEPGDLPLWLYRNSDSGHEVMAVHMKSRLKKSSFFILQSICIAADGFFPLLWYPFLSGRKFSGFILKYQKNGGSKMKKRRAALLTLQPFGNDDSYRLWKQRDGGNETEGRNLCSGKQPFQLRRRQIRIREAADRAAALIDAIYVQERTDDTDAQCAEAKKAWDALTDEQKELVAGGICRSELFREIPAMHRRMTRNQDEIGENELFSCQLRYFL